MSYYPNYGNNNKIDGYQILKDQAIYQNNIWFNQNEKTKYFYSKGIQNYLNQKYTS